MSTAHTQTAEHIHIFASGLVLFLLSTYHFPLTIHFCRVPGKSDPFCCFEQRLPFTCKISARCGHFQSHLTTPSSSFAVIINYKTSTRACSCPSLFLHLLPTTDFRVQIDNSLVSAVLLFLSVCLHKLCLSNTHHICTFSYSASIPSRSHSCISSQSSNHLQSDQPSLLHKRLSTSPHQQWPLSLTPKLATWLLPGFASMLNPR